MPLACRNLYAVVTKCRIEKESFGLSAHVVIEHHEHLASEQDIGFCRVAVTMNRENRARQQYVDQSLGLCIKAVMEIEVHSQARTLRRLPCYFVKDFVVDYHALDFK